MNGDVLFQNAQSCLTMAAGSDRQPIESSVPGCGKPSVNPLTKLAGARNHISLSDHNYGKPLTPPDSCSPDHQEDPDQEPDTGNEDEGFTRCICGFKHDDGFMICCDKCCAWQHVECVLGIKNNAEMPDTYLCELCDRRPVDRKRAKQIQTKKIEEPTDEDDDEDGDVSDRDSDNTLSRVSLPNSTAMKENVLTKGKRKKRESARKLNQKEMKHNKRKRRKRKHITSTDTIPVDEETNGPWNINSPFPEHKHYEEAQKTVYIGNLENRSFPCLESNGILRPEQMCKVVDVQRNKKGVVLTEDINGQQFIIECKGNLMLESKFKEDHPIFSKCDPFVLYYTKLELVMNFSMYGNDARFIRRSCSPTAEVRHVTVDNKPHLIVVSMTPLAKGSEVTLAFEFPFDEYRRQLECACAQENCKVLKHNEAIQRIEQTNGFRSSKDEHGLVDSSLSNHMDSDSDGDSNTKDKRSRKKLSREDRKLQQYLRQFEKMEKTEKKKQQHSNGRDGRTGILTQRNYPDDYNGETPSKTGKSLRKQSLSQRQQRKIQAVRRGNRLTSCSSEPLSPEDNYSSAASTPTTPSVNVAEENIDHHLDTPDNKSFKFPKFKKGSLNDVNASSVDASQSNHPSPEGTGYRSPSKSSFEARLLEVDEQSCDRLGNLHVTVNGGASPRTDPNCSPSPCHSTSASPTHSEIVDPPDMFSRHHLASPGGCSVASYSSNSGLYRSNPTHTTLKKRWLLQYANERSMMNKFPPPNGITTSVYRTSQISRVVFPPKTFPLPYKRRKLMEYQRTVNSSALQPVDTALQTGIDKRLPESVDAVSSVVKISSTMTSSLTTSPSTASSVTSLSMISPVKSLPVTPFVASVSVASQNNLTSIPGSEANMTILTSTRTTTSGGVTESEEASLRRRVSGGSDDTSVGRCSISSISSTDDIKMDATPSSSDSAKIELNSRNAVGSSSEANRVPTASQGGQVISLDSNAECTSKEDTLGDKTAHVGSSGVVEGSGATSTTQTTPGGKKKVSLMEYRSRKQTTGTTVKKDAASSSSSSEVTSVCESRVSDTRSLITNSGPVSSAVNYHGRLGTHVSTSGYDSTLLLSTGTSSGSSSRGVMIEPVSPVEGDRKDENRPVLHKSVRALQSSSKVECQATPSVVSTSYRSYSRPVSDPGSNSDAMDIDDDDVPSSSTILLNNQSMSEPGTRSAGVTSSDMIAGKSYSNIGQPIKFNVTSVQSLPGRQVTNLMIPPENHGRPPVPVAQVSNAQVSNASLQLLPPHADYRAASNRSSPFH